MLEAQENKGKSYTLDELYEIGISTGQPPHIVDDFTVIYIYQLLQERELQEERERMKSVLPLSVTLSAAGNVKKGTTLDFKYFYGREPILDKII